MEKKKRNKRWSYHRHHSYELVKDGSKVSMMSQQYRVGTYVILNNNPSLQFNTRPSKMVSVESSLKKQQEAGEIKNLELIGPITVEEVDGLYQVVGEG